MITDEERREVAQKLRERTKKPMGKSMQRMFTETLGIYAHNICWMNPDEATNRWDVIVNYLADLIDRPTTTRHGKFRTKYGRETPCCNVCGYSIGDMRWNYCPKCGAVITDAK